MLLMLSPHHGLKAVDKVLNKPAMRHQACAGGVCSKIEHGYFAWGALTAASHRQNARSN